MIVKVQRNCPMGAKRPPTYVRWWLHVFLVASRLAFLPPFLEGDDVTLRDAVCQFLVPLLHEGTLFF